jgi:hypothetical protein
MAGKIIFILEVSNEIFIEETCKSKNNWISLILLEETLAGTTGS